jgi:hypothetical protein
MNKKVSLTLLNTMEYIYAFLSNVKPYFTIYMMIK